MSTRPLHPALLSGGWSLKRSMGMRLLATVLLVCLAGTGSVMAGPAEPLDLSHPATATVKAIDIVFTDPYPGFDEKHTRQVVAALIPIRPHSPFDPARVQAAISALDQSGLFAAIHVDVQPEQHHLRLEVDLTPARRIRAIAVRGHYPLFAKDVTGAMAVSAGGAYLPRLNTDRARRVADLYRSQGFGDPQVTVQGIDRPGSGLTDLAVTIVPGAYRRLGTLTIQGNRHRSDLALKVRMQTWRRSCWPGVGGRFIDRELKADVEGLVEHLRATGHAAATVAARSSIDPATGRVDVTLTIAEGPLVRIVFQGNRAIGDKLLRQDLTLAKDGMSDAGLRRAARNMAQRYRAAGFSQARVEAAIADPDPATNEPTTIRFTVAEGPKVLVENLAIHGNRFIGEKQIRDQVITGRKAWNKPSALVKQTLDEDILAVERLYLAQGFTGVRVGHRIETTARPDAAIVHLDIDEGPQTLVAGVTVTGAGDLDLGRTLAGLALVQGAPFRDYMLDSDANALAASVSEKGFAHVQVTPEATLSPDRRTARIVHHIDTGPAVILAGVLTSGNLRTGDDIVEDALDLPPGQPLSLRNVQQGRRRLARMAIFEKADVQVLGLKEKAATVVVQANVVEKKPFYGQSAAGFESHRGLFAEMRIGDRNLWGRNKDVWVGGQVSQIGYHGHFGLSEPALFGWPLTATAGGWTEQVEQFNQQFGTRSTGGSMVLSRQLGDRTVLGLGFTLEQREQFRSDNRRPADPMELEKRALAAASPSLRYDGRDDFIRPTRGVYAALAIDFFSGLDTGLDDFVRYRSDLRCYATPWRPLTLALMGRAGLVDPWARPGTISEDQLFFLGGIGDVRGYKENMLLTDSLGKPVGGRRAWSATAEARIDLGADVELTVFMDAGQVGHPLTHPMGGAAWRSSIGLGLRYHTPIGPIGLLYGHKLDRLAGESDGRFHVAIGYTF